MNIQLTKVTISDYPNSCSRAYLENILISLDNLARNKLDNLVWQINNLTINFSNVMSLKESHPEWVRSLPIDIVIFSKIMFLVNVQNLNGLTLIRYRFDSIVKTLYYLANNNIQKIDQNDYEMYLSFFLMNRIDQNRVAVKLTPLSFHTYSSSISNKDWYKTIGLYQLPKIGFATIFSDSFVTRALKNTIEEISDGEIGFGDWKTGGNFNRLTLDYGRYYIDHCCKIFEQHIGLATALRQTLTQAGEIVREAGLEVNNRNLRSYVMLVIGHFLAGKKIEDFPEKTLEKHSKNWIEAIHISTIRIFKNNLNNQKILDQLITDENVDKIAEKIQFELDNEAKRDWLRQIIYIRWTHFSSEKNSAISKLRSQEVNCLINLSSNEMRTKLNKVIDEQYKELTYSIPCELPTPEFFSAIGIVEKGSQSKFVNNFLRFVECAGAVKFVALTGWRESEFGLSLGNINCFTNHDILDQYSNPIRYEISWVVPKTNGSTHLKREITYGAYSTALKLSELVQSDSNFPCLYTFNENRKNPNDSKEIIPRLISYLWTNFVDHYSQFKKLDLIDELNLLSSKSKMSDFEASRLNFLKNLSIKENWEILEDDINLREAKLRSLVEFDRVKFLIEQDSRREFVWNYKIGALDPKQQALLDTFLSEETKKTIFMFHSKNEISAVFTRGVINEVIQDCLYPTPHAIRHMWAEAVYRRFDGDAGWMIRSNFKHISPSMWLAYIKNKDNRRQHDRIKRQVISSLLNNYIKKMGKGYAGPLDKLLRRLFNITHVTKPEDLAHLIEQFATNEIESIKSSDWGFCLLMKRNKANAKCAEQGVPQRHKASPALCLGCNNNLSQIGNIEGILLGISNDLNVLKEPKLPENFFNESFKTVSNAFKHLTKLNADKEILSEINECLKTSLEVRNK